MTNALVGINQLAVIMARSLINIQPQNAFLPFSLDIDPVLCVLVLHINYTVEVVPLCMYSMWFVIV